MGLVVARSPPLFRGDHSTILSRDVTVNPDRYRKIRSVLDRRQPDLTVLMERVNKSHNFSAIVRNSDAAGVLEVHAVPPESGLPVHHHTSGGTTRWVEVLHHPTVTAAAAHLKEAGFTIVAAHPQEDAQDYREVDFTRATAIMVGAELDGVSEEALEVADELVVIPMKGMVRSLNVSVAASLLLYEAVRQRESAGLYGSSRLSEERYRTLLFEWAHPRIAEWCRKEGVPYPALNDEGELAEPLPTGLRASPRD